MRIARLVVAISLGFSLLAAPATPPLKAQVAVGVSIRIGPPVLPVYEQPLCPGDGYIWQPGYWAYGPDGYYWVPGTWVFPPEEGLLWTPGYWAFDNGFYAWNAGYWGPVVGFYGGINYGFGYAGSGFYGGYWRSGSYYYNRSVTNINVTQIHNTYNTTVVNNRTNVTRVSFNGGSGGTTARATSSELAAARERRATMTAEQTQHEQAARSNHALLATVNHGRPDVAATPRAGNSNPRENPRLNQPNTGNRAPATDVRPPKADNRVITRDDRPPAAVNRSNPAMEEKQQRDLDKLRQKQDSERQKMQQKQTQEQQKLDRQRADQQRRDVTQQRQQQQAERLQQKHSQQVQQLQQRQQRDQQRQQPRPEKPSKPPNH